MSTKEDLPSSQHPEIVDTFGCKVTFADWIVTAGVHESVVNITFGAIDHAIISDNGVPRIIITSRLRFSRDLAVRLYNTLGGILGIKPESPPSPPEPAPIPRNKMN